MVSTHFLLSFCPFPRLLNSFFVFFFVTETCRDIRGPIFSTSPAALTTEARSLAGTSPPPRPPSNSGTQPPPTPSSSSSRARGPLHCHGRLYPALYCVMAFGDAVEACKVGGEDTAKLTVKLGRATYVTDTGYLPPDLGCRTSGLGR